ncbi:MAG: hypothetical protein EHM28_06435 [Spirochaetaceae bacterium]|nr:MAG: hypothetical protein EHM28_06435 [Spirochaetaceae bacterium]
MKLRTPATAAIVLIAFIGGITGSIIFNLWKTTSTKDAADITKPADIKGSLAFSLIGQGLGIPLQDLITAFAVKDKQDILCKELESLYADVAGGEIGTDSVRYFAALYTGLPFTPEDSTKLPIEAYEVLAKKLSAESLEAIKDRFISVSGSVQTPSQPQAASTPSPSALQHPTTQPTSAATDRVIKGSTTFDDLLSWGVTKDEITSVTGKPVLVTAASVKSLADSSGVEFSSWKTTLQAIVDGKK